MLMFALQSGVNAGFVYGDSTALWVSTGGGSLCSTSDQELLLKQIS